MSRYSVENPKSRAGVWERVAGLSLYYLTDLEIHNMERPMKYTLPLMCVVAFLFIMSFNGCSNNNTVTPVVTDQQVLQQMVKGIDSVAEFSTSDEATIDDNGLKDPDYSGAAKEAAYFSGHMRVFVGDSLKPLRWGRHIFWTQIVRNYNIVMQGDTAALVTITKTIPGEFWIGFGTVVSDTAQIDTVVHKPFTEQTTRNVLFRRIANTSVLERNWLPVAITLVQGKSQTTNPFLLASVEVIDSIRHYDTTITDPLTTWFKLGILHGSIPRFIAGDSILVRASVLSSDDSNEVVVLRHSVAARGLINRVRMNLISVTGGPTTHLRVYERRFRATLPLIALLGRYNALVDVFSHGSLYSLTDPFMNEFWGSPYIVVR